MALEIRPGKSNWWYGRVTVNGRYVVKNLGVEIQGRAPQSLRQEGDGAFERSRARAQVALEQFQFELKKRSTSEELVQKIHEIRTGSRVRSVPLKEMVARWKALPRRRPPSERYVTQVEREVERFIALLRERFPMAKAMADVQAEMAREFLKGEAARGVAPKTYNNTLILLRSCFHALRKEAGLAENPFDGLPTREEETVFRKPFSTEELVVIIEAAKADPFIEPIIIAGICTAMRRGDCCLLLKIAVDLPNRFIKVKSSKTGELVQIPIFPLLYGVLTKLEPNDSPYVFPEQATMYQCNPDGITYRVSAVLRQAGFGDGEDRPEMPSRGEIHQERANGLRKASVRNFHSFRVTWVTLALSAGVPLEIVQKVTGHRTVAIVMKHYFQPGREEFRRTLAGKLPALLSGRTESRPAETLKAEEITARLNTMTVKNWRSVREELVRRLAPGAEQDLAMPG